MTPNISIYAPLLFGSLLLFGWSCYRRLSLIAIGKSDYRLEQPGQRLLGVLVNALGQKRVLSGSFGMNHAMIFWAFLVLLVANAEFLLSGLFPGLSLALLPAPLHHLALFGFDVVSLLALVGVLAAACRRLLSPPDYLTAPYAGPRSAEALLILGCIALLMLAYFGLHGAVIARGQEPAGAYMPVSSFASWLLAGLPAQQLLALETIFWWLHAALLLLFLNYLPHSKHMHILTAIPNCFFRSLEKANTQPREEFIKGARFGAGSVDQLAWKDLLDGFSCTECGRCQSVCPAVATGKPLNPRQVVHDIKVNLLAGRGGRDSFEPPRALIGAGEGSVAEEAIWSCTSCGACMSVCPVQIEHTPKIVKLRRHLVQEQAKFPEELLTLFENIEGRSNPWGIAPSDRAKWQGTLEVQKFDADNCEYLFYVGCAGSFDSRQKQVTVAVAGILNAAGVSWGTLGKDEPCCGDSLRRLGNEYVFDTIARRNVELFKDRRVVKVITACPHCFTTLKNDYRQYGLELEVLHHSELIDSLLGSGKLKLNRQVADFGKIVFHDSCYLGRHNDVYQPPRQVIAAATGRPPVELERNQEKSFCCGAGGGRMWMEEQQGTRINLNRIEEALTANPDTLCTSCPFCLTMFSDGLKDVKAERTQVKDIAEVVAEAVRQDPAQPQ
jgi:Fe-S oxidoreductase